MGKIIKFRTKINTQELNINNPSEDERLYTRKEITIKLDEIDYVLNCVYKQILINNKLIIDAENNYNFSKLTYLNDFNNKLHDIMYFLTNSSYHDPIIIKLNFIELKYLLGTLELNLEMLEDSKDSSLNILKSLYNRLLSIYKLFQKELMIE
ncbi:hypothetical protein Ccar_08200 [Clostridium carboxidivorans P7]|uniref:Uncharacterized protein n=1 Tax=Clostridium carboxidivorans P7 TaxID=536227 RepID=C6Q218_9CLOT|nr:hypothetical protein [Clostridium carboxidivorans]AKN30819.1 hypothetical protein Ccar_08200 [Clostridium carboxidivorans P7]EET84463.1 hypothetical protein CcarbDRAFT_5086 [Clostridium carboxidivorans P7]EFG88934.1 hypothetical protein CLCAR_1684 [Clostridium carboxidivorans P7]